MNTATIVFYCCIGAYFVGLSVWALVKRHKAKKQVNKEKEDIENEK